MEGQDIFPMRRRTLTSHRRLGRPAADTELVLEVRQRLLQVPGVERLAAAETMLEPIAVAGHQDAPRCRNAIATMPVS